MSVQAIAGVSPTLESRIMTEFPSVAASGIGRLIGQIMDSIPIRIFGVKLSYLLFGLPLAPLGMLLFLLNRSSGSTLHPDEPQCSDLVGTGNPANRGGGSE